MAIFPMPLLPNRLKFPPHLQSQPSLCLTNSRPHVSHQLRAPSLLVRDVKRSCTAEVDGKQPAHIGQISVSSGNPDTGAAAATLPGDRPPPIILLPPHIDSAVLNIANGVHATFAAFKRHYSCARRQTVLPRRNSRCAAQRRLPSFNNRHHSHVCPYTPPIYTYTQPISLHPAHIHLHLHPAHIHPAHIIFRILTPLVSAASKTTRTL